ncbi:serine/threonine-protein kinase [Nocardia sp. NPDC050406]|uniref:serine/threonine-protein kinase n=1 Tax=Nocardia sp. NPDC050406 TaxID=3364318 RepID=UPI0037A71C3E
MAELRPGEVLAGYVIEGRIGAGGSGEVYVARHPRLPRRTAIKVLNRAALAGGADALRRFEREADITARFDHPNIVAVHDRGIAGGRLWISMQYIEGGDTAELRGIDPVRALRIGGEIASALDYAHGKGVLHRDVKPSNILLAAPDDGRPERALLTDFGIARLHDDTGQVTRTGDITATFAYASPEQLSGATLTPRSDQYSLACAVFVLLTGRKPFEAPHAAAWVYAHTQKRPLRVTEARPELPTALDEVFDRALAKDPGARFSSCTEFLDAAVRSMSGAAPRRTAAMPVHPTPYPDAPPTEQAGMSQNRAAVSHSRKRPWLAAAAALVLGVGATTAVTTMNRAESQQPQRDTIAPTTVPDTALADSWGPDHAPIAAAFPRVVGQLETNGTSTGWQGATCKILDPGSNDLPTTQGARRIVCNPDDAEGRVRFDIVDLGAGAQDSPADVFFGGQGLVEWMTHPDSDRGLLTYTEESVGSAQPDSDAQPVYLALGFPFSDERQRFILIARWPGHTAVDLRSWFAKVPLR